MANPQSQEDIFQGEVIDPKENEKNQKVLIYVASFLAAGLVLGVSVALYFVIKKKHTDKLKKLELDAQKSMAKQEKLANKTKYDRPTLTGDACLL